MDPCPAGSQFKPLFRKMILTRFKDGRVDLRHSGVKGLITYCSFWWVLPENEITSLGMRKLVALFRWCITCVQSV